MKRKLKDINIPIKMKIENLTKESVYNKFSDSTDIEFYGDVVLEVFGEKIKIGDIMIVEYYKTMSEIIERLKEVFLSHIKYLFFDVRY